MAIKIYDNYFSLIIKVDSIKRIYGENNFGAFLKEFFPKPVEKIKTEVKKKDNWFKSLFSKPQITYIETIEPKEVCTLDDYSFMQGAKKFNHITSIYGHDGNLVFISCFQEDNIYAYCDLLDKKGFYGYKSTIYIENVDYVIFEKNGFPISVQWLETIEEDKGSEITSPSHIYSISPFKQPIRPMSFPSDQGGIGYDTELQWDLCQKHIQDKKFSCFTDLIDINIIYDNCSIAHKLSESRDDWFRIYEAPIDLTNFSIDLAHFSLNREYKLLTLIGGCIRSYNFIPLYRFMDDNLTFRMNGGKGEQPVSKHELILKLMREVLSYRDRGLDSQYHIQFQHIRNKYVGIIKRQSENVIIEIETNPNKIKEFRMLDEALLILSQIAEEWNNGHALFIERYLADDFKYILCEGREVFGNKILNKIEYIIWWECTLKTIKERGDTFCSYYTHTNVKGIACSLNGLPKSIRFSIEDGLIISAKEFWKL